MGSEQPHTHLSNRPNTSGRGLWLGVFVIFVLLYALTCQRSFPWQDSGIRAWQVVQFDLYGLGKAQGLAVAHPGYVVLAQICRLLPRQWIPAGINFFSGLGMAIALANLAAVTALLTGRRWAGLAAAGMLGVAHTVWWLSTIAEAYTWSVAGLTAELWLLVVLLRRPTWGKLVALALISGLGLCVHNFALLPLPVYVVAAVVLVVRRRLPAWALGAAAGAWVLGAGLYLGMTIELAVREGFIAAIGSALVGGYGREALNIGDASSRAKENAAIAAMNFASLLVPLAVVGWWRLRRWAGGPTALAIAAITIIEVLFVVRYPVPDQFMFLLPSLVMMALAAGVGAATLAQRSSAWRRVAAVACVVSILLPPAIYAIAPSVVGRTDIGRRSAERSSHRDELRYWLTPWKHNENSAQAFAEAALAQARPDGVILPDSTSKYVLMLVQQWGDGLGDGVSIQHDGRPLPPYGQQTRSDYLAILAGRPLYVVKADPDHVSAALLDDTRIIEPAKDQVLNRLEWRQP
ncbi:hypothetical protein LCGC14_0181470 [marine sediment metagenome]|uniref:DUF2723 domain-containing protein n=1 Tax=marine sediment metagenome TaxID=412755 RepID=A0A0F9UTQ0_9ZZZZ|nr:DUF2723 domain-containing protein [Phycisphaerae bacterium]HDZ44403.1 DUF2723 domain-containing protein [Phycisphaerae bacterium]